MDVISESLNALKVSLQRDPLEEVYATAAVRLITEWMKPVTTTSKPINVEDAKAVLVGEVYLVNVVTSKAPPLPLVLPILGPLHDDAEVPQMGASFGHWHVDWRFIPDKLYRIIIQQYGRLAGAAMEDLPLLLMHFLLNPKLSSEPQRRPLRCVRRHSHFTPTAQPWLADLEKANLGKRVCDNICPHRGFSLVGAVEDANGNRLCPGHGLAWNKQGGLVRQTS
jgi:hypothetical protein